MAEDPGRNIHQNKVKQAQLFLWKSFSVSLMFFGEGINLLLISNGQSMKDGKA